MYALSNDCITLATSPPCNRDLVHVQWWRKTPIDQRHRGTAAPLASIVSKGETILDNQGAHENNSTDTS